MKYMAPEMVKMVVATVDVITASINQGDDVWFPEV